MRSYLLRNDGAVWKITAADGPAGCITAASIELEHVKLKSLPNTPGALVVENCELKIGGITYIGDHDATASHARFQPAKQTIVVPVMGSGTLAPRPGG